MCGFPLEFCELSCLLRVLGVMQHYGQDMCARIGHISSDVFAEKLTCIIRDYKPKTVAMDVANVCGYGGNHFWYL